MRRTEGCHLRVVRFFITCLLTSCCRSVVLHFSCDLSLMLISCLVVSSSCFFCVMLSCCLSIASWLCVWHAARCVFELFCQAQTHRLRCKDHARSFSQHTRHWAVIRREHHPWCLSSSRGLRTGLGVLHHIAGRAGKHSGLVSHHFDPSVTCKLQHLSMLHMCFL